METTRYTSEYEQAIIFTTKMTERDMAFATDPTEIIRMVRSNIAGRITDQIMEKLAPAIDKAINEVFPNNKSKIPF